MLGFHEVMNTIERYTNKNMMTLKVRLVRSFEYRNMRNVVLRNVDLDISVEEFSDLISAGM